MQHNRDLINETPEGKSISSYKPRVRREGETSNNIFIENDSLCQPLSLGGDTKEDQLDQYSVHDDNMSEERDQLLS